MYSAFYLIDVTETNKHNPRNYLVPRKEEIKGLEIGDLVKIVLRKRKAGNNIFEDERVWVKILYIKEKKIIGVLEESAEHIQRLKKGSFIVFNQKNITEVGKGKNKLINQYKSVVITCKAIQHGEINWALKTTPFNKNDSGWQLFYGDEEYEYLDNPSNMMTITIKEVLNFEPLLEEIFISRINSAEYNSKLNKFIEI